MDNVAKVSKCLYKSLEQSYKNLETLIQKSWTMLQKSQRLLYKRSETFGNHTKVSESIQKSRIKVLEGLWKVSKSKLLFILFLTRKSQPSTTLTMEDSKPKPNLGFKLNKNLWGCCLPTPNCMSVTPLN